MKLWIIKTASGLSVLQRGDTRDEACLAVFDLYGLVCGSRRARSDRVAA